MTKATTNVARVAAAVAGLGLVAVSFAPMAGAQTSTTTTTTTTTSASVSFSRDLHVGSSGADVSALQTWLIGQGFSIKAGATGFFGGQTKAAVKAFQVANGIVPASGYFGPITRAKVAAMGGSSSTGSTVPGCAAGAAFSSTTGQPCAGGSSTTISGGEGSIDNLQVLGSPSNTTLYQGQTQQVFGVKFQADGSDLQVNRVDFDVTNNGVVVNTTGIGQDRPWAVLQTATLYDGSNVIGTVDASNMNNWSQDGNLLGAAHQTYRLRFGGMNDVVKMGSQVNYYLAFTAQNGISNANQTQFSVSLANSGIRATDAKGINQYSGSNTNGTAQLVSVSNAAAGTVVISTGSDNPAASTVMANQSAPTQNVTLGTFTINSQNAATQLYTLPVALTVSATSSAGTAVPVQDLKLVTSSGTVLDSEAILGASAQGWAATTYNSQSAATSSVTFKNMNYTIPANSTQSFKIVADINPVGGTNTGNALEGSFAAVNISSFTGADIEQGSTRITPSGSLAGNQITFHVNGLSPDASPSGATANATAVGTSGTQQGNFVFTFNVTAFGQDVFISKNAATSTNYSLLSNGTASGATSTVGLTMTADTSANGNYVVHAGQSKQVTVTVTVPAGNSTTINAKLNSLIYSLTDTAAPAGPTGQTATLNNNYQTPGVFIHS